LRNRGTRARERATSDDRSSLELRQDVLHHVTIDHGGTFRAAFVQERQIDVIQAELLRIVAFRSCESTALEIARNPMASVSPYVMPALTPPPAAAQKL
jgi:hypothetical protein